MDCTLGALLHHIDSMQPFRFTGKVKALKGLTVEVGGISHIVSIGSRCEVVSRSQKIITAEVIGFRDEIALMMGFGEMIDVGTGCLVHYIGRSAVTYPDKSWLGRVINCMGEPIDEKGPLWRGQDAFSLKASPPPAHRRKRMEGKIDLGIKVLNSLLTCCRGQRLGIFAGSGVGKSTMLAMITRFANTDVKVIGLIGERGREVQDFINDYLGPEGLAKAVVIVATSDESALARRQAAYMTMAVAEYFRDQGQQVICMIDSITRFAMAQREIGLAAGEPPTTKGYTPTVFAELPKLLERAGPGCDKGDITGLFSVLVDGDDHNEPIADAVRGILDGHIVLDRAIAERGLFPPVNVLRSISRSLPGCNNNHENALVSRTRNLLSTYSNMADMIRLGAYKPGTNAEVDEAMRYVPEIEKFLAQTPHDSVSLAEGYAMLAELLHMHPGESS
jgi:flagellum-specific ATP synthase